METSYIGLLDLLSIYLLRKYVHVNVNDLRVIEDKYTRGMADKESQSYMCKNLQVYN